MANQDLRIVITADGANAASAFQHLGNDVQAFGGKMDEAAGKGNSFFSTLTATAGGFIAANIFGKLSDSLGGFLGGLVSGPAQFETFNTQFGVLMQNTDEYKAKVAGMTSETDKWGVAQDMAKAKMAALADFAQATPFELPQVVQGAKVLQGFGLAASDTKEKFGYSAEQIMTIAGDTASGTGASFEEMAGYLGKFSKGATGEVISRFQELGITSRDELGKMGIEFNQSTGQMITDAQTAMPILLKVMSDHYGGMMEKQSQTFDGMMSNLSDWVGKAQRTLGAPIFEVLKDKLSGVLTFLGSPAVMNGIQAFANSLATGIGIAIDGIGIAIDKLRTVLTMLGIWLGTAKDAASNFGGKLVELANVVFPVASENAGLLEHAISTVGDVITAFGDLLQGNFAGAAQDLGFSLGDLSAMFSLLLEPIQPIIDAITGNLVPAFQALASGNIGGFVSGLNDAFNAARLAILNFASNAAQNILKWLVDATKDIGPKAAQFVSGLLDKLGPLAQQLIGKMAESYEALIDWAKNAAAAIIPLVGQFASNVLNGLATLVQDIGPKVAELGANIISWIGDKLPELGQHLGEFAATILSKLGDLVGEVAPALANLAGSLLNWLVQDVIPKIGPALVDFGAGLIGGIWNVISQVGPVLLELGGKFLSWLGDVAQQLPGKLVEWAGKLLEAIGTALAGISDEVGNKLKAVFPDWSGFFDGIGTAFKTAWDVFSGIVSGAWNALFGDDGAVKKVWNAFTGFLGGMWAGISATWDTVFGDNGAFATGINAVKNVWEAVFGASGALATAWGAFTGFIGGAWAAISAAWDALFGESGTMAAPVNAVKNLWNAIFGTGGAISTVWTVFTGFVSGLWSGVSKAWDAVFGDGGAIATAINFVKTAWDGLFGDKGLFKSVWTAFSGWFGGIKEGLQTALNAFKAPFETVIGAIRGVWQGLYDFIKGIVDGIKQLVSDALGAIGQLPAPGGTAGVGVPYNSAPPGLAPNIPNFGHALGGLIGGAGTSTSDSIITRVSAGEFIVPAKRVDDFGAGFFDGIRRGTIQPDDLGGGRGSTEVHHHYNVSINGNGDNYLADTIRNIMRDEQGRAEAYGGR